MPKDLEADLTHMGSITPKQAQEIVRYIESIGDAREPEAQALLRTRRPGKDVTIASVHPRNVLINWDKLLMAGVNVLAATASAVGGGPIGVIAAIGLCLTALTVIVPAVGIELSDTHSRVVEVLYRSKENEGKNPVPIEDLRSALAGKIPPDRFDPILDDLSRLKIIQFQGDNVIKLERLYDF